VVRAWLLGFALLALLFGCGREIPLPKLAPSDVIVAFGDSLTAGTGADAPGDAYYAEIATALDLPHEGEVMNEVLREPALKSDRIHANSAGYRRIGERLALLLKDAGAV
jgi:acyl-CoA thioesterase I